MLRFAELFFKAQISGMIGGMTCCRGRLYKLARHYLAGRCCFFISFPLDSEYGRIAFRSDLAYGCMLGKVPI